MHHDYFGTLESLRDGASLDADPLGRRGARGSDGWQHAARLGDRMVGSVNAHDSRGITALGRAIEQGAWAGDAGDFVPSLRPSSD